MKIPAKLKVTFWLGKEEYEDQWHRVLVASPTFVAESVSVDPIYFSFFLYSTLTRWSILQNVPGKNSQNLELSFSELFVVSLDKLPINFWLFIFFNIVVKYLFALDCSCWYLADSCYIYAVRKLDYTYSATFLLKSIKKPVIILRIYVL